MAQVTHVPYKPSSIDELKPENAKLVYEILARVLARKRAKASS